MAKTNSGAAPAKIRLGLIGDNIKRSRSPDLHRFAGQLCGLDVSYDLLIPRDMGKEFEAVFRECREGDIRGVNVTYPYKEKVIALVSVDPLTARIGSANTVVFEGDGPKGYNTDYSGFVAAYRTAFGDRRPGSVALIGAGGVGKAITFGLTVLGASEIRIIDQDLAKAEALGDGVRAASEGCTAVITSSDADASTAGADAAVNCTPVGMVGYPGSPVKALAGIKWAFDAVYTPVDTLFRAQALAAGASFLSGYELFFHQGIQAFEIFTGIQPQDPAALRRMLLAGSR